MPRRVEMRRAMCRQPHPFEAPAFAVGQVFFLQPGKEFEDVGGGRLMIEILDRRPVARRVGGHRVFQRNRDVDDFARHGVGRQLAVARSAVWMSACSRCESGMGRCLQRSGCPAIMGAGCRQLQPRLPTCPDAGPLPTRRPSSKPSHRTAHPAVGLDERRGRKGRAACFCAAKNGPWCRPRDCLPPVDRRARALALSAHRIKTRFTKTNHREAIAMLQSLKSPNLGPDAPVPASRSRPAPWPSCRPARRQGADQDRLQHGADRPAVAERQAGAARHEDLGGTDQREGRPARPAGEARILRRPEPIRRSAGHLHQAARRR